MKINDIITESLSSQVFHYTTAAKQILTTGKFQLSSTPGSIEAKYAPKGYPYFMSTTRTRHGGYHETVSTRAALFVLDGNWFNDRYPAKPIDYWGNRNPAQSAGNSHEAEDRVFSKDPTIPIGGVVAVHFFLDAKNASATNKADTRQALIAAKTQGIPAYFYTDITAWKNFDTRHQGDVSILTGAERPSYSSAHPGFLLPWIELIKAKDKSHLGKTAGDIRYNLVHSYNKEYAVASAVAGLKTELSNARKPSVGVDRENAVKIITFMRKNKLATIEELLAMLVTKWTELD